MKRPFLAFLAIVVVPCGIAMLMAGRIAEQSRSELDYDSAGRIARLTLGGLDQDLGAAVDSLLSSAEIVPNPDTMQDAVRRALAGDTVTALDPTESGVDIMVLYADPDVAGAVRFSQGRLEPGAVTLVGRMTGYRIALLANGNLWSATDPPPELTAADRATLTAAARSPSGVEIGSGTLVAMDPRPGTPAAIAAFAEPEVVADGAVPASVKLVMALLLLFSGIAAWIQLAEREGDEPRRTVGPVTIVLLSLVPTLSTVGLLVQVQRSYEEGIQERTATELTRTLAVVEALGLGGSPGTIRQMSGFHAARVSGGTIEASTFGSDAPAVAALPSPPPSFTTSGVVQAPEGPAHYVARRLDRTRSLVVMTPVPTVEIDSVRAQGVRVGVALMLWLALAAAAVTFRGRGRSYPLGPSLAGPSGR